MVRFGGAVVVIRGSGGSGSGRGESGLDGGCVVDRSRGLKQEDSGESDSGVSFFFFAVIPRKAAASNSGAGGDEGINKFKWGNIFLFFCVGFCYRLRKRQD